MYLAARKAIVSGSLPGELTPSHLVSWLADRASSPLLLGPHERAGSQEIGWYANAADYGPHR